jgi:hypothetical protein
MHVPSIMGKAQLAMVLSSAIYQQLGQLSAFGMAETQRLEERV